MQTIFFYINYFTVRSGPHTLDFDQLHLVEDHYLALPDISNRIWPYMITWSYEDIISIQECAASCYLEAEPFTQSKFKYCDMFRYDESSNKCSVGNFTYTGSGVTGVDLTQTETIYVYKSKYTWKK